MRQFAFYLEFDGRKTQSEAYDAPEAQIMATNIKQAIERFCKRKKLESSQYEVLSENTFRAYLVKKALFKSDAEYVYYIEAMNR